MSLSNQTVNGAFWTFIDLLINKALYFVCTIFLASILGPSEFGLIGMIVVFVSIGNSLVDGGMSTSVIRMNNPSDQDFATIFFTNLSMSIFVYTLIFFLAPHISVFYDQPILTDVIRVYCLGFIIIAFKSVHTVKLTIALEFRKMTLLNIPGNIISVVVAVWMAYEDYRVWSLVSLFLVNQIVSTLLYWIFVTWKPYFRFDKNNFLYHINFGYKLMLSSQLNIVFDNINNILIGKYYSVANLGFYERAFTFNSYPVSILSSIVAKVTLPTLAKIKDQKERLRLAYQKILQITTYVSFVGLGLAFIVSEPLFKIMLGDDWLPSIPIFQVLCLSFVLYPIHTLNINILSLFGRSDLFLKLEVIKKIVVVITVLIGFKFGIMGLVWSNVAASVISLFINTYYSGEFLKFSILDQFKSIYSIVITVVVVCLLIFIFNNYIQIENNYHLIIVNLCISLVLIIFSSEFFKIQSYLDIKKIIIDKK